jgi:hypothetical protein
MHAYTKRTSTAKTQTHRVTADTSLIDIICAPLLI